MYDSDFERNEFPLAYLITVRCYGTWLHGDERLTVDRHGLDVYGRSRRYLWKPKHVSRAIDYVLYGQGDIPDFND